VFNIKIELLEGLPASLNAVHTFSTLLRYHTPIIIPSFKKQADRRKWKAKDKGTKQKNTQIERSKKKSSNTTKHTPRKSKD
jgi:hypothetical protein